MIDLIHNVEAVFEESDSNVLTSKYNFYYVPLYQRGYKWTATQIEKLLLDIDTFEQQPGKFYCVQNITLVHNQVLNCFNVVDGQQRLTTMCLILCALGEQELVKNKLIFPDNSIREYTNTFLQDWILKEKKLPDTWEELIALDENLDHQDIYYLFLGYKTILNWFQSNDIKIEVFKQKLLTDVKFICNIVEGEKEEKIFGNLNSKRIYLDGADLVRAIIITKVTQESAKTESLKDIVRINERRVRIGWELDNINQWWNQDDVKNFFKPFIRLKSSGDVHFNLEQYPINQLLSLYAASESWDALSLERIEMVSSKTEFYHSLQNLHSTLVDWYGKTKIYHYLGFLFHQTEIPPDFVTLLDSWNSDGTTKDDFSDQLLLQIKNELFGENEIDDVFLKDKEWYYDNKLVPILVFLDIIEAIKPNRNKLHVKAFLKRDNDIEHIYPQNPRKEKDKQGYLNFLLEFNPLLADDIRLKDTAISNLEEPVLDELISDYSTNVSTDSIGNLVLLYYSLNRSIQNKSYAFKRKKILAYYNKGNYIQPHTLKVFSRYFQDSESEYSDSKFWTQADIEENEKSIKNILRNFFTEIKTKKDES